MASKMLQFLFISSPFGSVWYLWKLYVDELLTDSFVSQSNEHHFKKKADEGWLIWCNWIQHKGTPLHFLPHFDGLAC